MKKFGIIIFVILVLAVFGLWYLGGTVGNRADSTDAKVAPPIKLTDLDGLNEDKKLVALVSAARAVNGRPLLDPAIGAVRPTGVFRLTLADLQISTDQGSVAARRYSQNVVELFRNTSPSLISAGLELRLALEAFKEQAPAKTESARREAERYGRLVANLRAVNVPDDLKYVHLNLINALLGLAEIDSYLADILTEPIIALDQAQTYAHRYERLTSAVLILNQVLGQQNLPLVTIIPNVSTL
ncbi:MAG: hypothetical protein AAB677_00245 [Patescibacteria group bacterium]